MGRSHEPRKEPVRRRIGSKASLIDNAALKIVKEYVLFIFNVVF